MCIDNMRHFNTIIRNQVVASLHTFDIKNQIILFAFPKAAIIWSKI
jgi:hypothetical protein